jgi:hypothetical protein
MTRLPSGQKLIYLKADDTHINPRLKVVNVDEPDLDSIDDKESESETHGMYVCYEFHNIPLSLLYCVSFFILPTHSACPLSAGYVLTFHFAYLHFDTLVGTAGN